MSLDEATEMPQQVYYCHSHGDFEVSVRFDEQRPATARCPAVFTDRHGIDRICGLESAWRPSVPYVMGLSSATIRRHSYPSEPGGADPTKRKRGMRNVRVIKESEL